MRHLAVFTFLSLFVFYFRGAAQNNMTFSVAYVQGDSTIVPVARYEDGNWTNVNKEPYQKSKKDVENNWQSFELKVDRWYFKALNGEHCIIQSEGVKKSELNAMQFRWGLKTTYCDEIEQRVGIALSLDLPIVTFQHESMYWDDSYKVRPDIKNQFASAFNTEEKSFVDSLKKLSQTKKDLRPDEKWVASLTQKDRTATKIKINAYYESHNLLDNNKVFYTDKVKNYFSPDSSSCQAIALAGWLIKNEEESHFIRESKPSWEVCFGDKQSYSVWQIGAFKWNDAIYVIGEIGYWEGKALTLIKLKNKKREYITLSPFGE